jgi:hypothetical protein
MRLSIVVSDIVLGMLDDIPHGDSLPWMSR